MAARGRVALVALVALMLPDGLDGVGAGGGPPGVHRTSPSLLLDPTTYAGDHRVGSDASRLAELADLLPERIGRAQSALHGQRTRRRHRHRLWRREPSDPDGRPREPAVAGQQRLGACYGAPADAAIPQPSHASSHDRLDRAKCDGIVLVLSAVGGHFRQWQENERRAQQLG